jgi:5-dehydro-2-deoxygluconokinase
VRTFERFVGGFAANVTTGLVRLGIRAAIVSAVGDDGHGRFVRSFLAAEGVDVEWLHVHPTLRTPLAFCEVWPPDHFPLTYYRLPTCPDWELRPADLPLEEIARAPLLFVTGTGLAREPSRSATLAALEWRRTRPRARADSPARATWLPATVLDLDWRESLWTSSLDYAREVAEAARWADVVLGGESEFEVAGLDPEAVLHSGASVVVVKRGPGGVLVLARGGLRRSVAGVPAPVINGLGAGDAFAAAFGAGLLLGLDPAAAVERGNAAGAIVASRLSCSTAMPRLSELEAVLSGMRIQDLPAPTSDQRVG